MKRGCEYWELIGKEEEGRRVEWTETKAMKRTSKGFVLQSGTLEKLRLHSERRILGRKMVSIPILQMVTEGREWWA